MSTNGINIALQNMFDTSKQDMKFFEADKSGITHDPHPQSSTAPENRVFSLRTKQPWIVSQAHMSLSQLRDSRLHLQGGWVRSMSNMNGLRWTTFLASCDHWYLVPLSTPCAAPSFWRCFQISLIRSGILTQECQGCSKVGPDGRCRKHGTHGIDVSQSWNNGARPANMTIILTAMPWFNDDGTTFRERKDSVMTA